jgi:hypothetical protein
MRINCMSMTWSVIWVSSPYVTWSAGVTHVKITNNCALQVSSG